MITISLSWTTFAGTEKGWMLKCVQFKVQCHIFVLVFCEFEGLGGLGATAGSTSSSGCYVAHCNIILLLYYWARAPLSNSATGSVWITLVTDGTQIGFQLPTTELRFFGALCHCVLYTITITIYRYYVLI